MNTNLKGGLAIFTFGCTIMLGSAIWAADITPVIPKGLVADFIIAIIAFITGSCTAGIGIYNIVLSAIRKH